MNNRFRFATVLVAVATAVVIAACATSGASSAPPATVAASSPFSQPGGSSGEKKFGPYLWTWATQQWMPSSRVTLEVDCLPHYVVIGGGYKETNVQVTASGPNAKFYGWVVAASTAQLGGSVTVYASCALKN